MTDGCCWAKLTDSGIDYEALPNHHHHHPLSPLANRQYKNNQMSCNNKIGRSYKKAQRIKQRRTLSINVLFCSFFSTSSFGGIQSPDMPSPPLTNVGKLLYGFPFCDPNESVIQYSHLSPCARNSLPGAEKYHHHGTALRYPPWMEGVH